MVCNEEHQEQTPPQDRALTRQRRHSADFLPLCLSASVFVIHLLRGQ